MKLNPTKCIFATTLGKFLGFVISQRRIEANPEKIVAIDSIEAPHNLKTLQSCIGKIVALGCFLSQCSDKCASLFEGLTLGKKFNADAWTPIHQETLDHLKMRLKDVPILSPPIVGEELYLYLVASNTTVSSVLVRNVDGTLKPVYFVSQVYTDSEMHYSDIEKMALALVSASQQVRPYFQAHRIIVLTQHPLRQVLSQPIGVHHIIKWALELVEFDITYRPRIAIKAQVLTDFLVDFILPTPAQEEWELYIDGSSSSLRARAGVLLKSPDDIVAQHAIKLAFEATNNEAEYEALLLGLRITALHKVRRVKVYTDSQLITWQISDDYQVREPCIQVYLAEVEQRIGADFEDVVIEHILRSLNVHADALARLASATTAGIDQPITIEVISKPHPSVEILEILEDNWMKPILHYLTTGQVLDGVKDQCGF